LNLAQLLILQLGKYYSAMKKFQLGEFEEVVLLTVAILYNEAYGVSIKKEIEDRLDRSVSVGALQTALKRLEDKGYLKSREGEATPDRAGRPKRYFTITALGKKAMEYTKDTRDQLWKSIPNAALKLKNI
jgi:PadR family transcriptional regulator, regulatory protein PadR